MMERLFHSQTYHLLDEFFGLAERFSDPSATAQRLFDLLPNPIKNTIVLKDKLTNIIRYQYGEPFDRLGGEQVVVGTTQYPCVSNLYQGIKLAERYLSKNQMDGYLKRLTDQNKHNEVLFEMRPVSSIQASAIAKFEVVGYGNGNKTIDWFIGSDVDKTTLLVDVKYRLKSLVEYLKTLSGQGGESLKPTPPDPSDIFKNASGKFKSCKNAFTLQGVWANTQIKEDKGKLLSCFNALDDTKIHFLILSDWKNDAYVLARDESQNKRLKQIFNYVDSQRFVCDY